MLERNGAEVIVASSGPNALSELTQQLPDVLLCDIGMPEMDGYSLIREVRLRERQGGRNRMPSAALTAFASAQDRAHALASGFEEHVAKPVSVDGLVALVTKLAGAVNAAPLLG